MSIKLLTEQHFELLRLKGGWTGSSESTLVKIPHSWKSRVVAQLCNTEVTEYQDAIGITSRQTNSATSLSVMMIKINKKDHVEKAYT